MLKEAISSITSNQVVKPEVAEKFSQHTQHKFCECYAEKTPAKWAVGDACYSGDVTLISKEKVECNAVEKIDGDMSASDFLNDCESLPMMALRLRYKGEATSHRNMLARAKSKGAIIHASFRHFRDFLKIVGPMPAKGATLDRIDNADPEYAPGKVRWADKTTQNNNKGDTTTFYSSETGKTYTASRLAKLQQVSPATIRQRRARGWSDDEIIRGKAKQLVEVPMPQYSLPPAASFKVKQFPARELTLHEKKYLEMAEEFRREREMIGEEALPATLDILNKGLPLGVEPVTEEQYERRFAREFWPDMRAHVNFFNALPFHQRLIEKIDPEYVTMVRARNKEQQELKDKL